MTWCHCHFSLFPGNREKESVCWSVSLVWSSLQKLNDISFEAIFFLNERNYKRYLSPGKIYRHGQLQHFQFWQEEGTCHLHLGERHIVLLTHLISLQGALRTGTYGELQTGVIVSQCLGKESWALCGHAKVQENGGQLLEVLGTCSVIRRTGSDISCLMLWEMYGPSAASWVYLRLRYQFSS